MEVLFSTAFPSEPPFIRVVSPRFARHSGHITAGGSICTELLTSSGWSPAYTLESVLVDIRATIIAGKGQLDPMHAHVKYDILLDHHTTPWDPHKTSLSPKDTWEGVVNGVLELHGTPRELKGCSC